MNVSVIILNYNGKNFLGPCLRSLKKQTYNDFEIILVDNGSTDGFVNFVRKNFPELKIIINEKNRGFAEANNQGFKIASGEFIVTLNNDTETDEKWLENLLMPAKANDSVGMCASKVLSIYNRQMIDSVGVNVCLDGMSRGRGRGEIDRGQYDKTVNILLPSACAALYRRKMLDEIGFFDEDFFAYCEDTDLGLRARLAGWEAVLAPKALVYHHYSSTGGKYSSFKAFLVERNHCWVVIKNFPGKFLIIFPFLTIWRFILQLLAAFFKKGPAAELLEQSSLWSTIKIVLRAYIEAFRHLPELIKKRKLIGKMARLSPGQFAVLLKNHRLAFNELIFKK